MLDNLYIKWLGERKDMVISPATKFATYHFIDSYVIVTLYPEDSATVMNFLVAWHGNFMESGRAIFSVDQRFVKLAEGSFEEMSETFKTKWAELASEIYHLFMQKMEAQGKNPEWLTK